MNISIEEYRAKQRALQPPPAQAYVCAKAKALGLYDGIWVSEDSYPQPCRTCRRRIEVGESYANVPMGVKRGDSAQAISERARINYPTAFVDPTCIPCAQKLCRVQKPPVQALSIPEKFKAAVRAWRSP